MQLYAVVGGGSAYMITEVINLFMKSHAMLNSYEHLSVNVAFVVTYSVFLLHDTTRYLPFPKGTLHMIASVPYTCVAVMFFFHSTGHNGPIEARYHIFLILLLAATALTLLLTGAFPRSFLLDTLSNLRIILDGAWLLVTGFYALAALSAPSSSIDFILGTDSCTDGCNPSSVFVTSAAASAVVHPWTSDAVQLATKGQAVPMAAAVVDMQGEEASLLGDKELAE